MFSPQFTWTEFRRLSVVAAIAAIMAVAAIPPAHAQAVSGTLVGNVTDASGAADAGRDRHHHRNVNTNIGRTAVTNESGNYIFSQPPERHLHGRSRAPGLSQGTCVTASCVDVNTTMRVDLQLEVGAADRGGHRHRRDARAADRPHRHRPHHRRQAGARRCRWRSTATSRACSSPCRARRARSARTRSSSTRRTASRRRSTASRGSRTTCRSRASTTTTGPAC